MLHLARRARLPRHTAAFSVLSRPPPNYPGHVPLTPPERIALGLGSAVISLFNPRRAGTSPPPQPAHL